MKTKGAVSGSRESPARTGEKAGSDSHASRGSGYGHFQNPTFRPSGENHRAKVIAATMGMMIQIMVFLSLVSGWAGCPVRQIFRTFASNPT
jgi:hypothetical protein